jgi:hypothetical protein
MVILRGGKKGQRQTREGSGAGIERQKGCRCTEVGKVGKTVGVAGRDREPGKCR